MRMPRLRWHWILLLLLLLAVAAGQRPKRFVAFRKGSTFFYRLNYKVNVLPYTTMFAHASGFKVGWQLPEPGVAATNYYQHHHQQQQQHGRSSSDGEKLSPEDLRDAARLLYDRHGLDGQACLMKSLCQTMQLVSKRDGVLARVLHLMAGSNGANNATSPLDPLVCRNYANHCPLHLLGLGAFARH